MNLYIFDCFGVVVSDVSTIWMNKHLSKEQQQFMRTIFRKVDCGNITFEEGFEIMANLAIMPVKAARAEWDNDLYVIQTTVNQIDRLRAEGHHAVLLSNAARSYLDEVFSRFDLHGHFDKIFVSSDYGCAKPDREFYQICLDGCAKTYQKVFFTDDNPANLQGLESLGITPVLYK